MAGELPTKVTVTGRFIGGALFEPKEKGEDKEPKHNACIVLDDGESKKIKQILDAAIDNKFGNRVPKGLEIHGVKVGDDPDYHSFEREYINPKKSSKPETLARKSRNGPLVDVTRADDIIYPGCFVAVSLSAFAYEGDKEKSIKPGATLTLRGVMFRKHGDRLGDSFDESEFDEFDSEDDAFDVNSEPDEDNSSEESPSTGSRW